MKSKSKSPALFFVVIVALLGCSQQPRVQNAKSTDERPTTTAVEMEGSPEAALRQFMWARMARNEEALKEVVLQQEYVEWAMRGGPVGEAESAQIKHDLSTMEIRSLKVGHKLRLAGGKTFELTESHINENRRQLVTPRNPFPDDLVRIDGKWKVNVMIRQGEPPPEKPPMPTPAKPEETDKKPDETDRDY
jgi:hypothetical protein